MSNYLQPTWLSPWRIAGDAVRLSKRGMSLARRVVEELIDDLDGEEASETVTFSYRGTDYEVDLSTKNAAALDDALAPYLEAARNVGGRRVTRGTAGTKPKAAAGAPNSKEVREWAKANGIQVSDRGRVPTDLVRQYQQTAPTR